MPRPVDDAGEDLAERQPGHLGGEQLVEPQPVAGQQQHGAEGRTTSAAGAVRAATSAGAPGRGDRGAGGVVRAVAVTPPRPAG